VVAINANMDATQAWVPLSVADAQSLEAGFYELGDESIRVRWSEHATTDTTSGVERAIDGRWVERGVGGTSAATHDSGATLTRYYPEAPGGEGADAPLTLTDQEATPLIVNGPQAADGVELVQMQANGIDVWRVFSDGNGNHYFRGDAANFQWTRSGGGITGTIMRVSEYYTRLYGDGPVLIEVNRETDAVIMANLPTSNPNVAGQLWNDGGTLKVSAG
jgi:hypothetical protein